MTIETDADIKEITVSGNAVQAVITGKGDVYRAPIIASNANAKIVYQQLLDPRLVPEEVKREIDTYRTFSTAFKMNIACERPPQYRILDKVRADGAIGNFPTPPTCISRPTSTIWNGPMTTRNTGGTHAGLSSRQSYRPSSTIHLPPGKHVVNLFGGHAPYTLKGGDWATEKETFKKTVFDTIEAFAPGFSNDVIEAQLLVAPDIERIVNLPQGHIFHGELSTDQLFFQRPVSGYADYRTPISSLYICGSSMHPGGGVSGIPGANAAREILKDAKRRPKRGASAR